MDWDDVRAFLAVARQNQFVAAARRLKVNQATVARRVRALEIALGSTLFERSTSGVHLTEAGRRLLVHAERMESEMLQAEADLRRQDVYLSGPVRIGAPDGFMTYFLIPAMTAFLDRHPGIDLQLVPMPIAASLVRREVDIAITLDQPEAGRLISRRLTAYSLGIFGCRSYIARVGAPASLDDLRAHRLIGYVEAHAYSNALKYVETLFGGIGTRLDCASAVGQVEAVRHGAGLGILHHFIAATFPELEPVLPERRAERSYFLVVHEDVRSLGRIRAVADHIVDATARHRSVFCPAAATPAPRARGAGPWSAGMLKR